MMLNCKLYFSRWPDQDVRKTVDLCLRHASYLFACMYSRCCQLQSACQSVILLLTSVKPFQEEYSVWVSAGLGEHSPHSLWLCEKRWWKRAYKSGVSPFISGIIASIHDVGHVSTSLMDPQTCLPNLHNCSVSLTHCYLLVLPPPLLKKLLRLLKVLLPTPYGFSPYKRS